MPTTTTTKVKWTPSTIAAYNTTRDERRRTHGRTAWSTLSASERASSTEKALERARVLDDEISNLKTQAWELGKYPAMAIYVAQKDGMFVLPGIYSDGKDPVMLPIIAGDNLNLKVYYHYAELVNRKIYRGRNFVADDGRARRSDYLGPDPCATSFQMHGDQYHIEWYDRYLQAFWIDGTRWSVEVEYDQVVEGWVIVNRNG